MSSVVVIDYGMGNLHSVAKALAHAGAGQVVVTANHQHIREADRVVLPGVGAIGECMAALRRLGIDQLVEQISQDRPFLGICLGMQALLTHSEENGGVDGLGLFPGKVLLFSQTLTEQGERLKVPHMGWNEVKQTQEHPLWQGIANNSRFYFVHSFYVAPTDLQHSVGSCYYGCDFTAALAKGPCFAVQFHPEKSAAQGLQLYRNFLTWNGSW